MRTIIKRRFGWQLATATAMVAALCGLGTARAADKPAGWPARPVRLLVPLAAGSTADMVSRALATDLSQALGQPVVVENKPGAGGTIAMAELARSAPDGHVIAFASQGTLVFNQALYNKPGYDSARDFAPIAYLGGVSNVMIVHPRNPARTPSDIADLARRRPGEITFSSGGAGTSHHLSGVLFGQLTGTRLLHVPYKGAPQGILAVMSEEVVTGLFNTPTVIAQIRDGRLKALGVTSLKRSPLLPDVPTLDEQGIKGYEVNTWFGFIAPVGTPESVVAYLNESINRALAQPALRDKLLGQGFDLAPAQPPAAFGRLIQDDLVKWVPIVKASGAQVD